METIEAPTARTTLRKTTRSYHGEFDNPGEYHMLPADETHAIGYWGLEILEIETEDGKITVHTQVRLASLRTEKQMRSAWSESYHFPALHHRQPLSYVPDEILEVISEATGETILFG